MYRPYSLGRWPHSLRGEGIEVHKMIFLSIESAVNALKHGALDLGILTIKRRVPQGILAWPVMIPPCLTHDLSINSINEQQGGRREGAAVEAGG